MAIISSLLLILFTSASVLAQDGGTLSEAEQLRYQVVALQSRIAELQAQLGACQTALAPLRTEASTAYVREQLERLKHDIEAAHAGYVFDVDTGTLKASGGAPADKEPPDDD